MKKITLLILLLTTCISFSQVVLDENFDAALALPTGWTNNAIVPGPGPNIWTFETGGFAPYLGDGNTAFYTNGEFSGNYPILNSDGYGGGPEEAALESPVFSCAGLTSVTLSYKNFFVSGFGGEAYVEVYDGTSWLLVDSYSEANVAANTFTAGPVTLDVTTELAGVVNAQVRFRWVGDFSYYWAFDEVSVYECTVSPPDAPSTPTPADTAVDVLIDTSGATPLITPFSWVEATTGDPADSFNITLGTDPAGTNIGTVTGATNGNGITYGSWAYGTTYYWFVTAVNCAGEASSPVYSFTTEACTVTAPTPVTTPDPVDTAVDVPIVVNLDGSRTINPFSWVDGTGDPGTSFDLSIGITATGDDLGVVTGATNGNGVNYTWEYNTLYYWKVDAINCAGTSSSAVWSFTTEAFPGDTCADAIAVAIGDVGSGDTSLASDSGVAAGSCGATGANQDLWFSFAAPTTGVIAVTSTADHVVIYSDCAGTEVACLTDANGDNVNSLTSGATYYARAYNDGIAKVAGPVAILIAESTLSTNDFDTKALFTYFPNPVQDVLHLNAQQNIEGISIYNMIGQEVFRINPSSISSAIDLSSFSSGAYFVKVTIGNVTETVRIIKK